MKFFIPVAIFYISGVYAFDIPYEVCEDDRKREVTDTMLEAVEGFNIDISDSQTEADSCDYCDETDPLNAGTGRVALHEIFKRGNDIPPVCFYASALGAPKHKRNLRHFSCESHDSKPTSQKRSPPCLDKAYADMTARAFNLVTDCFNFNLSDKKQTFALMNHESGFMLNARSPTRARCYGQMTKVAIETINKNIYYRDHGSYFGHIYKDAVSRCPGLADKVLPPAIVDQERRSNARLKGLTKNAIVHPITCGLTHDPYSCLFYSLFNIKMNMEFFEEELKEPPDYMGRREPSKQMQRDLQFPVALNETLTVKGWVTHKETGEKEKVEWVFWDSAEAYDTMSKVDYNAQSLQIKKVRVFPRRTLKNAFTHYSHNGGSSIARTHLPVFVEEVKKKIASSYCAKDPQCAPLRQAMLEGKSLNISDLQTLFRQYVEEHNVFNGNEVKKFVGNIGQKLSKMSDEALKYIDEIDGPTPSSEDKDKFKEIVQEQCPTVEHVY